MNDLFEKDNSVVLISRQVSQVNSYTKCSLKKFVPYIPPNAPCEDISNFILYLLMTRSTLSDINAYRNNLARALLL